MAVAHIRLSEDVVGESNARGEVGLVNGGQFFGITMQSNTATASNGTVLLSAGNFIKDEWYGVMLFVDAVNGSRMRIWQLDDPSNFGETVVSGVGSGNWTFRDRVYDGTFYLDAYFEGIPYSETITRYNTTVQYDTISSNGIPDLQSLTTFKDLKVVWNTVTSVEQRNYDHDARYVGTKQTFTYATASQYGNLLTQTEYAGNNGTWTIYRGAKYEYYPNNTSTVYIVALPAHQVTLDCTGGSCDYSSLTGKVAETFSYYDSHTLTSPPTVGNLTKQRTWVKDSDYSQVDFTYYTNGNLKDQIVYTGYATQTGNPITGEAQTTTTEYNDGGYNTYPTDVKNALSQVTTTTYNYGLGLPTSVTTPNTSITSASYDGFGRITQIAAPNDDLGAPTLQIGYVNYNAATHKPFQINLTQRVDGTAWIKLSRFYDGAGRQIQSQTVNAVIDGVQKNVVVDYQYNSAGRLVKQSTPRSITAAVPVYVAQSFTQYTGTTYDALGRTVSVTQPNGNATGYTYGDLFTTVTDPLNISTTSWVDVWGRTTGVDAPTGPDLTYEYDLLGRLTDAYSGSNHTQIEYDAAGRKLNMSDPDMGYWQYEYDALGNLTSRSITAAVRWVCTTTS